MGDSVCAKDLQGKCLRGINPDLITYTTLNDSFGRAGHITEAL
jgi:hypothetical protein